MIVEMCVLRLAWDGTVHFLRTYDERQVSELHRLEDTKFANEAHLP